MSEQNNVNVCSKKIKTIEDQASWMLVLLGVPSFCIAGYFGVMLHDVVLEYIRVINEVGFTQTGIVLGVFFGMFAIVFWFSGCIASRCHGLLYKRWFQ